MPKRIKDKATDKLVDTSKPVELSDEELEDVQGGVDQVQGTAAVRSTPTDMQDLTPGSFDIYDATTTSTIPGKISRTQTPK